MKEKELQQLSDADDVVEGEEETEPGTIRLHHCDFTWGDPADLQLPPTPTGATASPDQIEQGLATTTPAAAQLSSPTNGSSLTLKDITLTIKPGQLTAVIGPVSLIHTFVFFPPMGVSPV